MWNIDIEQEDGKEISGIYQDVVDAGLNIGMWKSKIDIKDIEIDKLEEYLPDCYLFFYSTYK